jgi:hypothetical protein
MSHFKGHFEGAKTFLTPDNLGVKKVPQFLKQRDINSYWDEAKPDPDRLIKFHFVF